MIPKRNEWLWWLLMGAALWVAVWYQACTPGEPNWMVSHGDLVCPEADIQDGGTDDGKWARCVWDCVDMDGQWCQVHIEFERVDAQDWEVAWETDRCQGPDELVCRGWGI